MPAYATTTKTGQAVSWTLEQGTYFGAAPYHVIECRSAKGARRAVRYTPNEARARVLFEAMARGTTDPEGLARAMVASPEPVS